MSKKYIKNLRNLDSITEAIASIRLGKPVIVVDDEDRENEGDIVFAAQFATEELVGWTVRYSSGVICVPMLESRALHLGLPPMVQVNEDAKKTAYTVSCDSRLGVSTGISAADRALTIQKLSKFDSSAEDFSRPGHVFPLTAVSGGVLQRQGHTEAAIELCLLAECSPVAVIAEIVNDDGSMMRMRELEIFADKFSCPVISIESLVSHIS